MRKMFLTTLILIGSLQANISLDKNITDKNVSSKKDISVKDRSFYMPDIVTPDELKKGFYGGLSLGGSYLDFENSNISTTNKMLDFSVVAGFNINKYLAAETRALISIAYDDGVDFKSLSLFLKPQYLLDYGVGVYTLLGVGRLKAESINSDDLTSKETTPQFGLGADYKLKNNFKIFVDYIYLGKDKDGELNNKKTTLKSGSINAGMTYDF
jgi:opacity protein-like surface antigen